MNKEIKKKYQINFKKVTAILNEYDICGLLSNGSPSDEYDCLTETILVCFNRKCSPIEVRNAVIRELTEHFGCYDASDIDSELEKLLDKMITRIETSINN
jgi:hypothetical protein